MKFAIDRIEGNIAVCQNIENKEIVEVDVCNLPKEIKEGSVIFFDGKDYLLDEEEENKFKSKYQNYKSRFSVPKE